MSDVYEHKFTDLARGLGERRDTVPAPLTHKAVDSRHGRILALETLVENGSTVITEATNVILQYDLQVRV